MAKKNYTRWLTAFVIAALLTPNAAIFAEDEDLQNQLSNVQGQMAEQAQKKSNAEAVIGSVNERLKAIQINLDAANKAYQDITAQLAQTEQQMAANQKVLDAEKKKLAEREVVFSKRIRDIYMHGQLNYLDVVLGAKDFNDFANRIELLRRVVSADMDLIASIKEQRDKIAAVQQALEEERAQQVSLQADAAKKKDEIAAHKQEQQAVLYQAEHDKATADEAYRELEASSSNIANLLRERAAARAAAAAAAAQAQAQAEAAAAAAQQQASSGGGYSSDDYAYQPVSGSGVLIWPVNGVITSDYGYRTHPIFGTTIYHSGIDIGVDEGTPVHAADAGVVVEADWISGYGYAVIIDHGNGLSTLYGHNSALAVSAGQSVSQGEVIAYAGSTGNSTGPHVHFEVRSNGDPVNPLSYL